MSTNLEALQSLNFKGDVLTPGDPGYDQAIARWAKNAARKAAVVAFVKDAEDVSAAIKYAKEAGLRIAIRGGGHNPAGASSSGGGLVIDLSRYLNGARIDPEKKLAYVGGGAIWETVDKAAIKHGLATVGGTVNHVSKSRVARRETTELIGTSLDRSWRASLSMKLMAARLTCTIMQPHPGRRLWMAERRTWPRHR